MTTPFNFPDPFNFFMFGQNHTSFLCLVSFPDGAGSIVNSYYERNFPFLSRPKNCPELHHIIYEPYLKQERYMIKGGAGQGQSSDRPPRVEDLEEEIHRLREAERLLRRKNEHLTALHETSLGLIDRLDQEELLEVILFRAARLSDTDSGYIYLLEPGDTEMQMRVGMGFFENQLGRRVKMGEGVGGKVWETEAAPVGGRLPSVERPNQ